MRKVFIDCGSHDGCSVRTFRKFYADHKEYEIHCFEANPKLWKHYSKRLKWMKGVTLYKKTVWITSEPISFYVNHSHTSSTLEETKKGIARRSKEVSVEAVDLDLWIRKTFNKRDYIVMKIDIEGSEYEVFEKMMAGGSIEYVDDLYGELHAFKLDKYRDPHDVNNRLVSDLKKHNLVMWEWMAYEREIKPEQFDDYPLKYSKYEVSRSRAEADSGKLER